MGKIVKIDKSGKESLYTTFLVMTLVPLLIFGVVVTTFISYRVRETTKQQVVKNLSSVASATLAAYDEMYSGDYNVLIKGDEITLFKGDTKITGNTAFIDRIKGETNVDISLFFADTRLLTTISDENGSRYVGVQAADKIVAEVFLEHNEKFYDNVTIGRAPYYAYYRPIYADGQDTCLGMIGVAVPALSVDAVVMKSIYQCIAMLILFMLITSFFIVKSSSTIMDIIKRILDFLKAVANDNLDARLDDIVSGRKDELGEIGNAATKLQMSLKRLIERDALTGLYNRRAGERKLDRLELEGTKSSISIGDIDFFKKFNDNFGHECGDVVLKEVAACLNEGMRGKGFVARWGGEEFLLVFEGMEEIAAGLYLNDILQSVRDRVIEYDGQTHSVTMTFGVVGRVDGEKISDQIRRADDKLYEGKQGGRNRVVV